MHLFNIWTIVASVLWSVASWNIQTINNPSCNSNICPDSGLTYIKATNQNESVHVLAQVYENAPPSVIAIHSRNPNAQLGLNWISLNTTNNGPNFLISLDNVTESYGFVFIDLLEMRGNQSVADMFANSGQKNLQIHYFWKLNWKLASTSPDSSDKPLMLTYIANGPKPLVSTDGQVQLKFWIEPNQPTRENQTQEVSVKPLALHFELSLTNFLLGKSLSRLGLQLALASNLTVINSEDYAFDVEQVDHDTKLGVVHLDSRVAAPHFRSNAFLAVHQQPAAWFGAELTCQLSETSSEHASPRKHVVKMSESREPLARNKHKNALKRSILYAYYGQRLNQNVKPLTTMEHVHKQWDKSTPPPIGLRIQNLAFGTPNERLFNGSDTLTWRGRFEIGSIRPSALPYVDLQQEISSNPGHPLASAISASQFPPHLSAGMIALIALIVIGIFVILLCAAVLLLYHCRYRLPLVVTYKRVKRSTSAYC